MKTVAALRTETKLFNSFNEYKEYLNAIPEHPLSLSYKEKNVKNELELIEKFGIHKTTVVIAKVGDKLFRVAGNETVKALNQANTELFEASNENYAVIITGLDKEEQIKDMVEGIKVQYSFY
jgi:hypothetical protein